MKLTLSTRLHSIMREITRRKAKQSRWSLGAHYHEAIRRYLAAHKLPKRIEKSTRAQIIIQVPDTMTEFREQLMHHAVRRQQPEHVIIEEAIQEYIDNPENYCGETFYRTLPKKEYI